jgi:hypothetical protein
MADEYGWWYLLGFKGDGEPPVMIIEEERDLPWGPEEVGEQRPGWKVLASCRHQPSTGSPSMLPFPGCNISDPDVTLYPDALREFLVTV